MKNVLLKTNSKEIKELSTGEILDNLDMLYYVPRRLSKIIKLLTIRKVKHPKALKAAIYLQRIDDFKVNKIAMEHILSIYDTFAKSCTLSECNTVKNSEQNDYHFLKYEISKVKESMENKLIDENVMNFCTNFEKVFINQMRTENKKFLDDVTTLLQLYGKQKNLKLEYYKDLKIYDKRIILVLIREKRFKRIIRFMMCVNGDLKPKSALVQRFISFNDKWKKWQGNGFPEYKKDEEFVEKVLKKGIIEPLKYNNHGFYFEEESKCKGDEYKPWMIDRK